MNRLLLTAVIAERDALRYTPAGIPVVAGKLRHDSEQAEAGMPRRVEVELSVIAAGEIAGRFQQAELGCAFRFSGFLARRNRNSKGVVFHVTDFETYSPDHSDTGANDGIR